MAGPLVTTASSNGPAPSARPVDRAWEDVRCRQCRRLLCKQTRNPLKASEMIEIKCGACNSLNYLYGHG
jgi:phage FluMu protein Com